MNKIITGDWDGQPIWREQTAEEVLQKALAEKPTMKNIHMQATEEKFCKYPSTSRAHQIEGLVDGVSIDYGHNASRGGVHKELLNESEEERLNNPY